MEGEPTLEEIVRRLHEDLDLLKTYILAESKVAAAQFAQDAVLTLREAAEQLRVNVQTLRRGFPSGRYPFLFRDGHLIRANKEALQRWLAAKLKRSA